MAETEKKASTTKAKKVDKAETEALKEMSTRDGTLAQSLVESGKVSRAVKMWDGSYTLVKDK